MAENQQNKVQSNAVDINKIWYASPIVGDYNPGTKHGQEIFKTKTKDLFGTDKCEVITKNAPALRKLLIGKNTAFGGNITRVNIKVDAYEAIKVTGKLIEQYLFLILKICSGRLMLVMVQFDVRSTNFKGPLDG